MFACLMILQFLGSIALALIVSPCTWIGSASSTHIHVWAALFLGGSLTALPVFLALCRPGERVTRQVVAISQALYSALLIHLMGGRIEAHFHVFGSLAFLAFYRDLRVMILATLATALDHFVRGMFWPESVFGILNASNWRWVEHAAWVVFIDIFLIISIKRNQRQTRALAYSTAELELSKQAVESQVEERTRELSVALEKAEAADHAKSDFLANMSHEIRTPMTAILGYADVLVSDEQADLDQALHAVNTIHDNAKHLLTVIDDVLDVSKIEAGQMAVEKIDVDPAALVEEVAEIVRPRANGKGLDLRVRYESNIPVSIESDPTRLKQVLLNLVGNAVKFTEHGSVTLSLACEPERQQMTIRVTDTGIGMTAEQLEKILHFKAFEQADSTMSRRFGGTGLGLKISNAITGLLGGNIQIESEPNAGSTFTVTIATGELNRTLIIDPDTLKQQRALISASKQATKKSDAQNNMPMNEPLDGMHVLLAEDGPDNQRLISFHLKKAGATVTVCENGLIAAQTIEAATNTGLPDVVLMDMQMPELDGYSATKRLRDKGCELPIIALTAHAMEGDRDKCINAGCDDYATKPIDKKLLIELCEKWAAIGKQRLSPA